MEFSTKSLLAEIFTLDLAGSKYDLWCNTLILVLLSYMQPEDGLFEAETCMCS